MSRTHYLLVDRENVTVSEADLDLLKDKPVHVTLVLGQQHKALPISMVKKLLQHAGQVELVESKTPGKNALDLILVSHLGIRGRMDPEGVFHIIAKDKDYKPVVAHFKDKGWSVFQHDSMAKVPGLKNDKKEGGAPANNGDLLARVCGFYRSNRLSLPKTKRALQSHIQSSFSPKVSDEDAHVLIQGLVDLRVIEITADDKVKFVEVNTTDAAPQATGILCMATATS